MKGYNSPNDAPFESNTGVSNFWDADNFFSSLGPLQFPVPVLLDPAGQPLDPVSLVQPSNAGASAGANGSKSAISKSISSSNFKSEVGKGSKGSGEESAEDQALMTKRKKALIASRTNREKRKRQINELKKSNAELFKERMAFRKIVADLQLQVQANREAGKIDLETENELLRAELREHKTFIAQFKSITDGTPVSNAQKHLAALQGANAANGQVLGVLHTSTVDPSWKRGYSRLHPELSILYQRLPLGSTCKTASRITLRVDFPLVKAPLQHMHDIQWLAWSDSDLSSRLSSHFGQVQAKEIKEIDLDLDDMKCGPDTKVKVYYYREERPRESDATIESEGYGTEPQETDSVDTIFLITSKKQDLPYNALPFGPSRKGEHMKKTRSDPRVFPTIVMATTSTKHARDIVSARPGVHRIESALLEGMVLRQVEANETSCTYVASYPLNIADKPSSDFLSATSAQGWIDDDGFFTNAAEQAGNDLMRIHAEMLSPETAQSYLVRAVEATSEAAKSPT